MTEKIGWLAALACIAVAITAPSARADNTTCANAMWMIPDGSSYESAFVGAETRWFRFGGKANRSYAVMTESLTTDGAMAGGQYIPEGPCGSSLIAIATVFSWSEPVAMNEGGGGGIWSRWSLRPTTDQDIYIGLGGGAGLRYRIRVEETTQFNTFFSTYGGFETFYRFLNTTNGSINVTLRMVSDTGAVVSNTSFDLAANSSVPSAGPATRNTGAADLNVPDNTAGFAVITHNGPPGGIATDAFLSRGGTDVLPLKVVSGRQQR